MKKCLAVLTAVLAVLSVSTGCSPIYPPAQPYQQPASESPNFRLLLSDEPNDINDFSTVMVTITGIGLQKGGESGEWVQIDFDPVEVDLKTLIGTNASEVWAGALPEGEYVKAFIYISDITATLTEGKAVVKIPSGKLQISKPFTVDEDGNVVDFVFDITIIKAGESGQYIVKPQIGESGADKEYKEVQNQEREQNRETNTNNGVGKWERDAKIRGTIEAINGATWTVAIGGETYTVDVSGAQFKGEPAVGLMVKINGTETEGSNIAATYVHMLGSQDGEKQGAGDGDNEIEFSGPVTSLSPLVIAGYTVVINEATNTRGEITVGATFEVEGVLQEDGTVLAKKLSVEGDEEEGENNGNNGNGVGQGKPETTKTKTNNGNGNGPKK